MEAENTLIPEEMLILRAISENASPTRQTPVAMTTISSSALENGMTNTALHAAVHGLQAREFIAEVYDDKISITEKGWAWIYNVMKSGSRSDGDEKALPF